MWNMECVQYPLGRADDSVSFFLACAWLGEGEAHDDGQCIFTEGATLDTFLSGHDACWLGIPHAAELSYPQHEGWGPAISMQRGIIWP